MQARLVDYSDSEEDEEMEWREYHKQRSILRIPTKTTGAGIGSVPVVEAEDHTSPFSKSASLQNATPDRDFAFTPRKRASRFRSKASPFSRSPTSPLPPFSPDVDFSFSPTPSPTASSMSDSGETKRPVDPWASSAVPSQSPGASTSSDAALRSSSAPFTFGTYNSTEAAQSASPFAFGADKSTTAATGPAATHTAFTFDAAPASTTQATTKQEHNRSAPFTFGSFHIPENGVAGKSASFLADHKTHRRSISRAADGKTPPLRQKDLHRAAKRRVSGGSAKSSLSGFGGSPASTMSTPPSSFTPFEFAAVGASSGAATGAKVPMRKMHSPMDVEMDENASSSNSFSGFSFDSPKFAAAPAPHGFSFETSTSTASSTNPFGLDPHASHASRSEATRRKFPSSNWTKNGARRDHAAGTRSQDKPEQLRGFFFGSCSSDSFSEKSCSTGVNKSTSFTFGSQTSTEASKDMGAGTKPHATPTRSSSFSFNAAFKEYDVNTNPWAPTEDKETERTSHDASSAHSDGATIFAFGNEKSNGRESLEVRLARRKQAREAKAAVDQQPVQASIRPGGAQKALFKSGTATATHESSQGDRVGAGKVPSSNPSFTFGQNGVGDEKMRTNVFQRPPPTTSTKFSPTPSNSSASSNPFSFTTTSPFTADEPSKGGVFTFGASAAEPEPNPSPPPVDNLKSNFDGFNIGQKSKAARFKPAKVKLGSLDPGPRIQPNVTSKKFGEKDRSPFAKSPNSGVGFVPLAKTNVFTSTPAADPFVMPIFGQKRNNQQDVPMQEPDKQSTVPSPFVATNPSHNRSIPVFGRNNSSKESAQPHDTGSSNPNANSANWTPLDNRMFSIGTPGSVFLPGRRILRACRPTPQSRSTKSKSGDSNGTEETHRGWSEWKSLGGSAYTKRAYQEAADCYLNSIIVLENLLTDQPELKTDQLMKDKAKLHCNRSAALMMLLQLADAQRECYMSLDSDPAYTRAYMRLGRIQVMLGDVQGAKESSTTAKQLLAMNEPQRRTDASDTAGIEKIEAAVEKLEKIRVEIKWCLDVHDYSRALTHLQEALAVAPHCRSLQTQKAHALFEQKNYAQVVEYCTGVVRKQKAMDRTCETPDTPVAKHDAATTEDNEVAMLGIELSMLRIRALHCENKVDDAMRHMHKLELAAPCSAKVIQLKRLLLDMKELKHQANELFKNGSHDAAQRAYSQALELDPTNDEYCAVIYCNRAAALMGLQQFENALHDCNAALRRKARYPRCLLRRARCNVALRRYAAAIADFDKYLKDHRADSNSSTSVHEVELERQKILLTMEKEAADKRRKEEQQKERQKNNGRSKPQQQQQQRRHSNRHAWDDSKFYDDFWRSSSSSGGGSRQQSSGARGSRTNATAHTKRRTHYDVLGTVKSATQDEIKKAYRKLALLHHPDKAKDTVHADLFKDMTAAYNILSDTGARAKYDREIQASGYGRYNEY